MVFPSDKFSVSKRCAVNKINLLRQWLQEIHSFQKMNPLSHSKQVLSSLRYSVNQIRAKPFNLRSVFLRVGKMCVALIMFFAPL
jgi:hypothetical protein